MTLKDWLQLGLGGGLLVAAVAAQGASATRTSAFEYDPATGLLTKEIVEPDNSALCLVTSYTFDAYGNKTGATTRNCSGAAGSHPGVNSEAPAPTGVAVFAARSSATTYSADGRFAVASTNALGHGETREFDPRFGTVTKLTGPNGLTTEWRYDGFGRKTLERRADGTGTKWAYLYCTGVNGGTTPCPTVGAAAAKALVVTTPVASVDLATGTASAQNGPVSRVYFDALGREIRSETEGFDPAGSATAIYQDTKYDALGRKAAQSLPYYAGAAAHWTTYTYDVLGRVTQATGRNDTDSADVATTTAYSGLTTTVTNAKGQVGVSTRNSQGQTASVTDAAGKTLSYAYDPFGNLVRTTDSAGNSIVLAYDARGRKIQSIDPDLGTWTYQYNALGELVRQTDAKGQATTLTYDVLGRLTARLEPDLKSYWSYDRYADGTTCAKGVGKLCEATSDNGYKRRHSYDSLGRPVSTATTVDSATPYTAGVTYDTHGRVDTQTWPTGLVVKNLYTARGYLKEVRQGSTTGALYWRGDSQDALGRLTQQSYGNGVVTTQSYYGPTGRIKNILAGTGNGVQHLAYQYDSLGNLTSRSDATQSLIESFTYDALNRLTSNTVSASAVSPAATTTYAYDALGNLVCKSDLASCSATAPNLAYGAQVTVGGVTRTLPHAVKSVTGTVHGVANPTYTYDANGNLTAAAGRSFVYTSFNMPQAIASPSYSAGFQYGPEHQRVMQTATTSTIVYLNPDQAGGLYYEKELRGATVTHKHYIAGTALVKLTQNGTGSTWSTQYLHRDALGSVTTVTDASGAVLERLAYDPWGKRRFAAGTADAGETIHADPNVAYHTDRGFTNHEHLDELGLIHMNGRIYNPAIGRFMSADPIVQAPFNLQSLNRYSYVWNNPLASTDPNGFESMRVERPTTLAPVYVRAPIERIDRPSDFRLQLNIRPVTGNATIINPNTIGAPYNVNYWQIAHTPTRTGLYGQYQTSVWQAFRQGYDDTRSVMDSRPKTNAEVAGEAVRYIEEASGLVLLAVGSVTWIPGDEALGLWLVTKNVAKSTEALGVNAAKGGLEGANFAQKTFSPMFSKGGAFAGRSVDDVAGSLRSGAMKPSEVPIDFIVRDGNTLMLNTRSAQALEAAGIPRGQWNAVNRTGQEMYENMLSGQLQRNGLTSEGVANVRRSGGF